VRYAAGRLRARLPRHVDQDDLFQQGVFGLMDAVEKFDPEKGVKFETYCQMRIVGSMLDGIRAADWVPRLVRSNSTRLEKTWIQLEGALGREPTDFEMAEALEMELTEYDRLLREISAASIFSYHRSFQAEENGNAQRGLDLLEDRKARGPLTALQKKEVLEKVSETLNEKERIVIVLYYFERLTFREIGEVLELTESRVCQIHSKVIAKLKVKLRRIQDDLIPDPE
jgi:RNA polymerase sigma factor for flagellar operon FliA